MSRPSPSSEAGLVVSISNSGAARGPLTFAEFARLAKDPGLSKYGKIGFPDSYRAGREAAIFADIRRKLPRLEERGLAVLDIGPGCSDLPGMLVELCRAQGHRLTLVDSTEMLAHLPDAPFVAKTAGRFPDCLTALAPRRFDVVLCYSVLHHVVVDGDAVSFLDGALSVLAPGGELLVGDIPNLSKRRRFFASAAGREFHKRFTGSDMPPPVDPPSAGQIDDTLLLALVERARGAGADAYLVPQDPALPLANRREDLLVRRP